MEYLKLIIGKAFGPAWTIFGAVTGVAAIVSSAIWGDSAQVQPIAMLTIVVVLLILLVRLVIAPYQLWLEDQSKVREPEEPSDDPFKTKRTWLFGASANLLTLAKTIHREWSVSDSRRQLSLNLEYDRKRARMLGLGDSFLIDDKIYRATQDAVNRCDIVISDAKECSPNHSALEEAHNFTKVLQSMLTSNGKI